MSGYLEELQLYLPSVLSKIKAAVVDVKKYFLVGQQQVMSH